MTFSLDDLSEPIVLAPLAGGPSTPALAAEVSKAGGLGFLGSGYKTAEAARKDVEAVRAATSRPFGLNIAYPHVNALTSPMRAAARQRGEPDLINLWAGQAYTLGREAPAAELMAELSRGWRQALLEASRRLPRA